MLWSRVSIVMVEIIESEYVPLPVVKELLDKIGHVLEGNPIVARVREHAQMFSKCGSRQALEALKELQDAGFTGFAATMLLNIVPKTFNEAKTLLSDVDGGYSDEAIEKALDILRKYCSEESS